MEVSQQRRKDVGWLNFIELKILLILGSIWYTTKKKIAANYSNNGLSLRNLIERPH